MSTPLCGVVQFFGYLFNDRIRIFGFTSILFGECHLWLYLPFFVVYLFDSSRIDGFAFQKRKFYVFMGSLSGFECHNLVRCELK